MTKEQFREWCEEVLVPRLGELLRAELREVEDVLGAVVTEVQRVRDEVEALEFALSNRADA